MEEDAFDAVEMLDLEIAKRFDAIYVREPKTAEDRWACLTSSLINLRNLMQKANFCRRLRQGFWKLRCDHLSRMPAGKTNLGKVSKNPLAWQSTVARDAVTAR